MRIFTGDAQIQPEEMNYTGNINKKTFKAVSFLKSACSIALIFENPSNTYSEEVWKEPLKAFSGGVWEVQTSTHKVFRRLG